jgi:hypothetical protein
MVTRRNGREEKSYRLHALVGQEISVYHLGSKFPERGKLLFTNNTRGMPYNDGFYIGEFDVASKIDIDCVSRLDISRKEVACASSLRLRGATA